MMNATHKSEGQQPPCHKDSIFIASYLPFLLFMYEMI